MSNVALLPGSDAIPPPQGPGPAAEPTANDIVIKLAETKARIKDAQSRKDNAAVNREAAKLSFYSQMLKQLQPEPPKVKEVDKPLTSPEGLDATARDVGMGARVGTQEGFVGIPGIPGSLMGLGADIGTWAANKLMPGDAPLPQGVQGPVRPGLGDQLRADPAIKASRAVIEPYSSPAYVKSARERGMIEPEYETKTGLGSIAKATGEAVGSSLIPTGLPSATLRFAEHAAPIARTILTQGVVPGAAGEIAGQAAERFGFDDLAPAARFGTAVTTGAGASAYANRRGAGASQISREIRHATETQLQQADELVRFAAGRGVVLPRSHALDAVTRGGTNLSALHASIEALPNNQLRSGLQGQPEALEAAARAELQRGLGLPATHPLDVDRRINQQVGEIRANSVPGQELTAEIAQAAGGPGAPAGARTSPEAAGNVIQPQLTGRLDQLRQARAAQAQRDYGRAYNTVLDVDVAPIDNAITRVLDSEIQKGPAATTLERAQELLRRNDGSLETRVEALHNSRRAMDGVIAAETDPNNIRLLTGIRNDLNAALDAIPGFRQADANFARASRHMEPLETGALGEITARERTATRPTMHPSDAPAALEAGKVGALDQLQQALPGRSASSEAYSRHLATQWLDDAGRNIDTSGRGHQVSAAKLRERLTAHEDELKRIPGLRDQVTRIIEARERLEQTGLTGRLRKLYDSGEATTVKAINTLFPLDTSTHALPELREAITLLNRRDPQGARQLMATWLDMRLERAMMPTQGGSKAMGGANFANAIAGGTAQRGELLEGLRIIGGDELARGFDRILDVMQATGRRQGQGSPTALRAQLYEELGQSIPADIAQAGLGAAVGEPILTGVKLGALARAFTGQWMREASGRQIADLLMNPAAATQFRALGRAGTEERARIALNRLGMLTGRMGAAEANR